MRKYIKKLKLNLFLQFLFSLLWTFTNVFIPYINIMLFNNLEALSWKFVTSLILMYFMLIALNSLFQYIYQRLEWKMSATFRRDLQKDLFLKVITLPSELFQKQTESEYVAIFNNDVEALDSDYLSPIVDIARSLVQFTVYAVALVVFVDWRVACVVILVTLGAVCVPYLVANKLSIRRKAQLRSYEKYFDKLNELLCSKHLVSLFTLKGINRRHEISSDEAQQSLFNYGEFKTFANVTNGFVMLMVSFSSFTTISILLLKGEIMVGAAVASFSYIENFIYPIRYILTDINMIHSVKQTRIRIEDLLAFETYALKETDSVDFEEILVQGLSVNYGNNLILDKVDLRIKNGEKIAIIGETGSGKSSLLKALLLADNQNPVFIDGIRSGESYITLNSFYSSQQEVIFSETLEDNITIFGSYPLNTEYADLAKEILHKETCEVIKPKKISGGEKQIIAFIRALNSNKDLLLFDEPFSSVDAILSETLTTFLCMQKNAVLLVTHDTSKDNLSKFDKVLKVKNKNVETYVNLSE
ncbi:ABC transporter ATP-binding protein [Erysipelothrix sp. HDW6B]|uniref:ABC transporter transmembrane domain-containing protein n=1 Tax=Erysipelothrix sp. HDW6B TaxID=2714929 RepID=UPI00140BA98A|nr:ABC transporter ATP-binding protein [Erysipelothrix sp. HDW6B]QIK85297.1 ABC transporter ATP-binding protein [Erysipelothrix sp. HDW6B]